MPISAEDGRTEAAAYATQSRDRVLRAYPHLAPAYAAEDRLRAVALAAKPLSAAVQTLIEDVIRENVATAVRKGLEPQVLPQTENALRLQVAFRNLDHVVGLRALDPKSALELPSEQRTQLVEEARRAVISTTWPTKLSRPWHLSKTLIWKFTFDLFPRLKKR